MMNTEIAYTEYAVEINNTDKDGTHFVRRLEDFPTYDAAEDFVDKYDESQLQDNEYLNIIFIDYNEQGDEIAFGSVE